MNKDQVIQGLVAAGKIFGSIVALASYNQDLPPQYQAIGILIVAVASTFKEGITAILAFLRSYETKPSDEISKS